MASIRATARAAARKAFDAAGDVLIDATVRLQPTAGAYDAATDSAAVSWGFTKATKALEFDDKENERPDAPEERVRAFLFLGEHLTTEAGVELRGEQEGEIEAGGLLFTVDSAETDPTGTVWIFYCHQAGTAPAP